MNNRGRWRIGAIASGIALLGSMASLEAHALALGRITVQSALGESLRAEIDITDLNAEETSSLRVGIATAEVFKAAGLEYTSAAAGLDVRLQRRADGRTYLRLSSNRAITEPFVDLILEAKWSSGRVTRDYTMLFDPPNVRANATMAAPTAPVLSQAAPVFVPRGARLAAREIAPSPDSPPAPRSVAVPKAPAVRIPAAERMPAGARQVLVKPGDNASRIAAQTRPASVSLDQMLVALLRSNPDAFIGGNINVIKSGAVLDIPDAQAASALSSGEATQTLVAQSKDFNTFRRKLAEGVPATQIDSTPRQVGGKVQARVEDRAQINSTPDKLTLSKGAVQGRSASATEDTAAREQEARDGASRAAELHRNNSDSNKPGTSDVATGPGISVPAPAHETSSATSSAGITPAPALATTGAADPNANTAASAITGSEAPLVPALEPMSAASAAAAHVPAAIKQPVVITPTSTQSGLINQIRENSLLVLGAGALLALLAGLGFARYRKTKKMGQTDSSFLDSRLQPDSFFGASGGRRIDTSESMAEGSAIAYSPSQLDASGDVDPVAEADVYLAYGRDQQAEEILKEALRLYPARLAIHTKLLEIYAKRRDHKAFESVALTAFKLSKGQGPEWVYISELGRDLDTANSLYQAGAKPAGSVNKSHHVSAFAPVSAVAPLDLPAIKPSTSVKAVDMDLNLDFTLDDAPDASMTEATIPAPLTAPYSPPQAASSGSSPAAPSPILNLYDLDLNLDHLTEYAATEPAPLFVSASSSANSSAPAVDLLSEKLDFTLDPFTAPRASVAPAAPVNHSGMLEFDLSSLSLDLGPTTQTATPALAEPQEDPLEVKFLLAEEFRILGDAEGARSLADEVMAKAKGPLKVKAQAFLNALS